MSYKKSLLRVLVVSAILFPGLNLYAAEADQTATSENPVIGKTESSEEIQPEVPPQQPPVEISPADNVEAGEAEHAFKQANPCEGMMKGEYLGVDLCASCHQDKVDNILLTPHGQVANPSSPFGKQGCETCHGPGELHFETEGNCTISMTGRYGESIEQRNDICLQCHQSDNRIHWLSSAHEAEGLACVSCHSVHKPHDVTERTAQAEKCYSCHKDKRALSLRASSHPIREGELVCSDCHNAHGSPGPSSLKQFSVNENCYSCHAEKRGPFLWEHIPASEDCTVCHNVHGSNHQALLNRPGPRLCQQCHATIGAGGGRTHISNLLELNKSSAGRARFIAGKNCLNCHSKVHGSNHPSGRALQR